MNLNEIYDMHGSGTIISNGLFDKVLIRREISNTGWSYYTKYVKYPQGEWKLAEYAINNEWKVIKNE